MLPIQCRAYDVGPHVEVWWGVIVLCLPGTKCDMLKACGVTSVRKPSGGDSMPSVAKQTLHCALCGKRYVWQPAMAGKRVRCNCGAILPTLEEPVSVVDGPPPMMPVEPSEMYDLIEPPKPVMPPKPITATPKFFAPLELDDDGLLCPECDHAMEPGLVICSACGFNFRTGQSPPKPAKASKPRSSAETPRRQTPAPPSLVASAAASLPNRPPTSFQPPTPKRYMMEKADPPLRRILAGVGLLVLLIVAGVVWHELSATPAVTLNSGKGEDPEVSEMIADDGATELHHWFEQDPHRLAGEFSPSQAIAKADELQSLGAVKVLAFGSVMSLALAIELPADPAKRAALFKWESRFAVDHFYKPDKDVGQRYLLLRLHP